MAGGLAVNIGLPLFDAMLNDTGTALAQGTPIPVRVGIWHWGNGLRPEHFFPQGDEVGALGTPGLVQPVDYSLKQHTAPLATAGVSEYVSLYTGTRVFGDPEQAHHDGRCVGVTGSWQVYGDEARGYGGPVGPSIDQLAAAAWAGLTPFRSLEFGVEEGTPNNEPGNAGHSISMNGKAGAADATYNQPECSPIAMYGRLFSNIKPPGGAADPRLERLLLTRRSVLDAVTDDISRLNMGLGGKDRACLDRHLTTVRSVEKRLGSVVGGTEGCQPPSSAPSDAGKNDLRGRNGAMAGLLALALSCDLTRAFTYQFTVFQTAHDFSLEPTLTVQRAPDGTEYNRSYHEWAHNPEAQDDVRKVTNFTFEQLAYLLALLRDTPEGDSNLLANMAMMGTTEHTEPMSHSTRDLPMLLIGHAGGRLKGGLWYHGNDEKASKAGLTLLRAAGIQQERLACRSATTMIRPLQKWLVS